MNWQDYLALALFVAATAVVARRAYRAFFGRANAGCASGCGSCSSSEPAATKKANLLTIGTSIGDREV